MKTIFLIYVSLILFGCGAQGPLYLKKIALTQRLNETSSKPILKLSNFPVFEASCNSITLITRSRSKIDWLYI